MKALGSAYTKSVHHWVCEVIGRAISHLLRWVNSKFGNLTDAVMISKNYRWISIFIASVILPGCSLHYQNYNYYYNKFLKEDNSNYIIIGNKVLLSNNIEKNSEYLNDFTWNIEKISGNVASLIYGRRESEHIVIEIFCDSERNDRNYLSAGFQRNVKLDDSGNIVILSGKERLSFKYKKSATDDYENYDIRSNVPNLSNLVGNMSSRRSIILTEETSQIVDPIDRGLANDFIKICEA